MQTKFKLVHSPEHNGFQQIIIRLLHAMHTVLLVELKDENSAIVMGNIVCEMVEQRISRKIRNGPLFKGEYVERHIQNVGIVGGTIRDVVADTKSCILRLMRTGIEPPFYVQVVDSIRCPHPPS